MSKWFISLHITHDEGVISYLGFMATFYASTSGKIFNIGKAINRKTLCYLSHINQKNPMPQLLSNDEDPIFNGHGNFCAELLLLVTEIDFRSALSQGKTK